MSRILGEFLKASREAKGLTIEKVAHETKIQKRYILDMEEENFDDMPGVIYEKGMLRTYGELLELDLDELFEKYNEAKGIEKEEEKEVFEEVDTKLNKRNIFLGIIAIIVMTIISLKVVHIIDLKSQNKTENTVEIAEEHENQIVEENDKDKKVANISEDEIEVVTSQAVEKVVNKKVEVKILGKTWVQIFINGKREKEGEFSAGEVLNFEGAETDQIFVKIGNINNADVYLNGQVEAKDGSKKSVWKKTF